MRDRKGGALTELQLPVTYKCNFNCVMCGMASLAGKGHFSPEELAGILEDGLFESVTDVGVNGGEPFIRDDICRCVDAVLGSLPNLEALHFITNGYFTDRILEALPAIKEACRPRNVVVNVSISLDGAGDMQDLMRGTEGAYDHAIETAVRLQADTGRYCDSLGFVCTVTKKNVCRLHEVQIIAEELGIPVSYNVATLNKRIDNRSKFEEFSVLTDERSRMLAQEFFFQQYCESSNKKYFALFLYLNRGRRFSPCAYKSARGITLNPDCQLSFCATHSDTLGDASKESAAVLREGGREHFLALCRDACPTCSHYMQELDYTGEVELLKYKLRRAWLERLRRRGELLSRASLVLGRGGAR